MKPTFRVLLWSCCVALLSTGLRAGVNETNNTPGYVMYVLVGQRVTCNYYYDTTFTCDHYLNYAVPVGESVVFNDHSEGGDCYHEYWVANITWIPAGNGPALSKAPSQAYSGTDIFPNICTNSQPAYKQARWKVSLPSGVTATLSATGGVALSKTSGIVNDDVVTVTAGSSTGTYQLTLTGGGSSVQATGTVFAFGFAQTVGGDYSPSGSTNGASYNGSGFNVNVGQIPVNVSGGKAANVSRNFEVKVATTPANVFSGNVTAAMRVNTSYTPYGRLHRHINDGGSTIGVAVTGGVGWIRFSLGGGGASQIAAIKHAGQLSIAGGSAVTYGEETWSTTSITGIVFPALSKEQDFGGSAITRQQDDSERTYTVGSTAVAVRTEIAQSANTSTNSAYATYVMSANSSGVGLNTYGEANGEFVIQ
jgi:hypothetical protein